jgi:hypothetical protein
MFAYCLDMPGVDEEMTARVDAAVGPATPDGLIAHVSGPMQGGWRIIDVWESEEHQQRFQADRLGPALALSTAGMSSPPQPFDFRKVEGTAAYSRLVGANY